MRLAILLIVLFVILAGCAGTASDEKVDCGTIYYPDNVRFDDIDQETLEQVKCFNNRAASCKHVILTTIKQDLTTKVDIEVGPIGEGGCQYAVYAYKEDELFYSICTMPPSDFGDNFGILGPPYLNDGEWCTAESVSLEHDAWFETERAIFTARFLKSN